MNHVFDPNGRCVRCGSHLHAAIHGLHCPSNEEIEAQEARKASLTPLLDEPEVDYAQAG